MKVSLNWLREYVDLPPSLKSLIDLLTLAGIEVEGVETRGCGIANVVVAQIRESLPHPNADRLSVCQVDDGSGHPRQIVCGATNYKVGDKVPLALPGAVLPGDFKIKVGKLRGVESQGMMCSPKELRLSEDAEGLLLLPGEAKVGAPIADILPSDTILEIEITPNRADLLSHWGIAEEIAALTRAKLKPIQWERAGLDGGENIEVEVAPGPRVCYTARLVRGVKIAPSPDWLRTKLESLGFRSINNVVDITNYVMLGVGQPLHAFDAAKLHGARIKVRMAKAGEDFIALDGNGYTLAPEDIVIADADRVLALAGIMGGAESGVTDATTDIVLESAWFNPASIRRTSRRLGLSSESSYRFERGVDPMAVPVASDYAARLLVDIARAETAHKKSVATNDKEFAANVMLPRPAIPLRTERVKALLGVEVSEHRIAEILQGFGCSKAEAGWVPNNRRADLAREVDLIEEIGRVLGMEAIPPRVQGRFAPISATDRAYDRAMVLRHACVGNGLHETRSITLVPARPIGLEYTNHGHGDLLRLKNPMIDDQVVLRPNLLSGLLTAVETNVRAGANSVRLFEIGRVFLGQGAEERHLAIVLSGPVTERSWRQRPGLDADLFHLKGMVAELLGAETAFEAQSNSALALALIVKVRETPVGCAGQLWPAEARKLDAPWPVVFAEIDLDALDKAAPQEPKRYREIPRFPSVTRDMSILAPLDLPQMRIASVLREASEPLLASVELFDLFTDADGEKLPAGKKSLAYSLTYRALDRTLTTDEVNAVHARLKERLKNELDVALRE